MIVENAIKVKLEVFNAKDLQKEAFVWVLAQGQPLLLRCKDGRMPDRSRPEISYNPERSVDQQTGNDRNTIDTVDIEHPA